jgi:hypothetical protein
VWRTTRRAAASHAAEQSRSQLGKETSLSAAKPVSNKKPEGADAKPKDAELARRAIILEPGSYNSIRSQNKKSPPGTNSHCAKAYAKTEMPDSGVKSSTALYSHRISRSTHPSVTSTLSSGIGLIPKNRERRTLCA